MKLLVVILASLVFVVGCETNRPGKNGVEGKAAKPCTVSAVSGGALIACPDGSSQLIANGVAGDTGASGKDAAPCTVSLQNDGSSKLSCPDGSSTTVQNGSRGLPGTPGSVITPVKFCASDTSAYPEFGLLIDGRLFAVYWGAAPYAPNDKEAFWTELIPGSYQSTGGNGCYFLINAERGVSH